MSAVSVGGQGEVVGALLVGEAWAVIEGGNLSGIKQVQPFGALGSGRGCWAHGSSQQSHVRSLEQWWPLSVGCRKTSVCLVCHALRMILLQRLHQRVTPHSFPARLKQESGYCTRSCPPGLHAQVGRLPRDPERVACSSILRLKICTGGSRTCHLFPFRLGLLILSFRGTLEALHGGKASFTLCLHPDLTSLAALASLEQEGSPPDHAPLCSS